MKIGITNLKGGVGKTTVAQNLAVCFAHMGYRTCIVDTDTNRNSLSWSAARDESLPAITVVGSTEPKAIGKMTQNLHQDYDVLVIDGTPSLSEMTTRIILASDILVIPILPSGHDFRAMEPFFERLEQAKEVRENIPAFFLLNQYNPKFTVSRGMREAISGLGLEVLETTLNKRNSYIETGIEGRGVLESDDEKAKEEVILLTRELLKKAAELKLVKNG